MLQRVLSGAYTDALIRIKRKGENTMEDHNLRVCEHCLMGIECHEGKQAVMQIWVDEDDEKESKCEWCEESGFDTLYELI